MALRKNNDEQLAKRGQFDDGHWLKPGQWLICTCGLARSLFGSFKQGLSQLRRLKLKLKCLQWRRRFCPNNAQLFSVQTPLLSSLIPFEIFHYRKSI